MNGAANAEAMVQGGWLYYESCWPRSDNYLGDGAVKGLCRRRGAVDCVEKLAAALSGARQRGAHDGVAPG